MGNRAYVMFVNEYSISPVVYLHWNGGPESVYAFLDEMERRKCRTTGDPSYGAARLIHVVCDFFDSDGAGGLSVGTYAPPSAITCKAIEKADYDMYDNGVFVIEGKNGDKPKMRRFVRKDDGSVREMTREEVNREEKAARKHKYNAGFAEKFRELRPVISAHR